MTPIPASSLFAAFELRSMRIHYSRSLIAVCSILAVVLPVGEAKDVQAQGEAILLPA